MFFFYTEKSPMFSHISSVILNESLYNRIKFNGNAIQMLQYTWFSLMWFTFSYCYAISTQHSEQVVLLNLFRRCGGLKFWNTAFVHKELRGKRMAGLELETYFFWKINIPMNAMARLTTPMRRRITVQRIHSLRLYPLFSSAPHRVISHTPEYLQWKWWFH